MTLAAFLRPAGSASPILSSLSRRNFPPFFDFALQKKEEQSFLLDLAEEGDHTVIKTMNHSRRENARRPVIFVGFIIENLAGRWPVTG